jgi:hypothetical protein
MAQPETKPMVKKSLKLDALREKKAALEREIAALQVKENQKRRKEDTRTKIIVGAAILANMDLYPNTRAAVAEILRRAVTARRDKLLHTQRGLLE